MRSLQDAQNRFEAALGRLEKALDREPATGAEDVQDLTRALAEAKADYADLKARSDQVADRLDETIARLRRLLGEPVA